MFEQIDLTTLQRVRRTLREFLDLSACRVFTVRQRFIFAAIAAAFGAIGALMGQWHFDRAFPPPVILLDPVIERLAADWSVYRIRFEHRGTETWCHIVMYHETGKWTIKC